VVSDSNHVGFLSGGGNVKRAKINCRGHITMGGDQSRKKREGIKEKETRI